MDKEKLKAVLRPVLKELIREIIFEDGTISKLISEAVRGLGGAQVLTETPRRPSSKPKAGTDVLGHLAPSTTLEEDEVLAEQERKKRSKVRQALESDRQELISERKKTMGRMLASTGVPMEIFETVDVSSIPSAPNISIGTRNKAGGTADIGVAARGTKGDGNAAVPLRGFSPNDAGVPITGILNLVGGPEKWTQHLINK